MTIGIRTEDGRLRPSPPFFVSVIIATRNRVEALRTVGLPSLVRQDNRDFEVIVWDASDDDLCRDYVDGFAAAHPDLRLRYYRAPRAGICAQRNDAVPFARGEIVFFIDDDSEVSPDGVAALRNLFARNRALTGAGLPLYYEWPPDNVPYFGDEGDFRSLLTAVFRKLFFAPPRLSGVYQPIPPKTPGPVDNLWGCDMAYKRSALLAYRFDERLQKYGGYALWEDLEFSHRLHGEGLVLMIAGEGRVTHYAASGDREGEPFNKGRMLGYNACVMWASSIFPYAPWSAIHFVWGRIGMFAGLAWPGLVRPWRKECWRHSAGYVVGLLAFAADEIAELARKCARLGDGAERAARRDSETN
jgi:glycosyltransferase involved in cell wall biosynthesis